MKILVIGGTRFLGYPLVRRLIGDGHQVILFNRGLTPDDLGDKVRRIKGDRFNHKAFAEKLKGESFDVVLDMIAYKAEDSETAIQTLLGNVGHFIHISTGAVYAITRDFPCPIQEEDFDRELYPKPKEDDELWLYGFHKRKCEEALRQAFQTHGFPVTIFRFPIVIGERDYTLRAYSYFIRIEDGKPIILPDSGLTASTHLYQGDIVRTIASNLLNKTSFGQAYNLAQEEILTLRSFILKSAEILKRKVELVDIPAKILERTSLGTSFSPFFGRRPFILSTEKAKRDLNFSSTPFETWLRKTIFWFKEEYRGGPPENYNLREKEIDVILKYQKATEMMIE